MLQVLAYAAGAFAMLFLVSLTPLGKRFRQRLMATLYVRIQPRYESWAAERKRALLAGLSGTVLEIGPGNGVNFAYFPKSVTRWIGLEPNPYMHAKLREAARRHGITAEFRMVTAAGMQVGDESVDVVLSTLVLCSVPRPESVLRDILRILEPGGRFVFLEHVGAPRGTGLRLLQRALRPLWRYLADGCCPDRDTAELIRKAGFAKLELEEFRAPRPPMPSVVSPHIAGIATKG